MGSDLLVWLTLQSCDPLEYIYVTVHLYKLLEEWSAIPDRQQFSTDRPSGRQSDRRSGRQTAVPHLDEEEMLTPFNRKMTTVFLIIIDQVSAENEQKNLFCSCVGLMEYYTVMLTLSLWLSHLRSPPSSAFQPP